MKRVKVKLHWRLIQRKPY